MKQKNQKTRQRGRSARCKGFGVRGLGSKEFGVRVLGVLGFRGLMFMIYSLGFRAGGILRGS